MTNAFLISAISPRGDVPLGIELTWDEAMRSAYRFSRMSRETLREHCLAVAIEPVPEGWVPEYVVVSSVSASPTSDAKATYPIASPQA